MNIKLETPYHVAIIGGGISGLATAWYLQQQNISYTILEKSSRWGGKIITDHVDDFVIEGGPDSFLTQKPWALQLARELGLDQRLLNTNDQLRRVYVLNRRKLTPLPDGVMLIVPTKFMPFARSSLISPLGKLRMAMEMFIPAKRDGQDETLAEFIKRRLGAEALDKIAEPLMAGIYNAEAEKQSLLATFPRFRTLEEDYGSLTKGMLAAQRKHKQNGHNKTAMFVSLQGGTQELVEHLVDQLKGDLRLDCGVESIECLQDERYEVVLEDKNRLQANAIVLAIPAYLAATLVHSMAPDAATHLESIRYVSTGTISLAFRQSDMKRPLDGFGVVIPRSENRRINAITWTSTKFNHRAPDGHVLLRVFFGGSRHPHMMQLADEELLRVVRDELAELMGITALSVLHRIYRWFRANPQYDVGHLQLVDKIEALLPPNIYVTGSPYRGIGIPDCVHQAQQTAQLIIEKQGIFA